jgi:hypothetical protein
VPQLTLLEGEMTSIKAFIENEHHKAYFLHFAGSIPLMKLIALNSPEVLGTLGASHDIVFEIVGYLKS